MRGYPDFRSLPARGSPARVDDAVEVRLGEIGMQGESNERLVEASDRRAEHRSVHPLRLEELTELDGVVFDARNEGDDMRTTRDGVAECGETLA